MTDIVQFSSRKFLAICAVIAAVILHFGMGHPISPAVIASEVFFTIISLFLFGSFRYQIHKNALTYGSIIIVAASFSTGWWPGSALHAALQSNGPSALWEFFGRHVLTLEGLDNLI